MTAGSTGMPRAENGLTLVDLLVTLMVTVILGLIGNMALQGFLANFRVRSAAREVVTTLHLARMRAVSQNTTHRVMFNVDARSYQLADGQSVSLPPGVRFNRDGADPITFTADEATFSPTGTSNGGRIFLRGLKEQQRYCIRVNPLTGRVRLQKVQTSWTECD